MTAMFNSLISTDPIVARNFYLEIPNEDKLVLSSVSGIEISLNVVSVAQNGKDGRQQHIKTLGGTLDTPEIVMTRMAPLKASEDPLWIWFRAIRDQGMKAVERMGQRKNGSIVLYDSHYDEVGRFNWFNGWPSKITTAELSTEANTPMTETITLQTEWIDRVK